MVSGDPDASPTGAVQRLTLRLDGGETVSGRLDAVAGPHVAVYVFAHGAGAGMDHPFMADIAAGLVERGIATLRYQFPFVEQSRKRPDAPAVAHTAVRTAVAEAARLLPGIPLFAGGKSFGGRMTSQAQAERAMPGVRGLVFFGFPLHPAGKPSQARAAHLVHIASPMLFVQGTRDALADEALLRATTSALGERATLMLCKDADHSFHVPARSGQTDARVRAELLDRVGAWIDAQAAAGHPAR